MTVNKRGIIANFYGLENITPEYASLLNAWIESMNLPVEVISEWRKQGVEAVKDITSKSARTVSLIDAKP